jgi:ubiquinone/menaquinone biosynthesis C-methylase UbiE
MTDLNPEKLNQFIGQMLADLGGAASVPLVRMGDALGLYQTLYEKGPLSPATLAVATGCDERYLREWLGAQAASNYVTYDVPTGTYGLNPEQAAVFADENSPVYLVGAFDLMAAMQQNQSDVQAAFVTGKGVGWGDQAQCLFCSVARFFRPGYLNNLVQSWLPALDGVVDKLKRGALVADVGCGHGVSTMLMARAFPNSTFIGYDFHDGSIAEAREHARTHGSPGNLSFEVSRAKALPKAGFDLITFFDCLHDMGDPAGAAAAMKTALKPDGTWMIVEPMAADTVEGNLNPIGRIFYSASTMICVPTSKAQEVSTALGAQAGEARLRDVIKGAGFSRVRRATETPFNMVLEARP